MGTNIKIEYQRRQGETIQNYVKRLLSKLYFDSVLTPDLIQRMHGLEYSKQIFGINYPLLATNPTAIYDSTGHVRYWLNYRLAGKYYVCSQWWKEHDKTYQENIYRWLDRLIGFKPKTDLPNVVPNNNQIEVGSWVDHKAYGKGRITEINDGRISVRFAEEEEIKKFPYPDALTNKTLVAISEPIVSVDNNDCDDTTEDMDLKYCVCPKCATSIGAFAKAKAMIVCPNCGSRINVVVEANKIEIEIAK